MRICYEFHCQVGFAIGQTTTHRSTNARSFCWIQSIHIKAKMDAIVILSRDCQCLLHHFGDTKLINFRHGEHMNGVSTEQFLFTRIKVARAHYDDCFFMNFGRPAANVGQAAIA